MNYFDNNLKGKILLAPMAGVADFAFRSLCREFGADFSYTEMISAKGLIFGDKIPKSILKDSQIFKNKTQTLLITEQNERPCAIQLFGKKPEDFKNALQSDLLKKFEVIDINMGCPAPKIIRNGEGSALMKDEDNAKIIIETIVKNTNKPVSVKFRKGYKTANAVNFSKMCEESGVSAITIHGRLMTDGYSGNVDYETIERVKKATNIFVIGSGDVVDKQSYEKMVKTGVDAVMVGRGALGKPWIFSELKNIPLKQSEPELRYYCAKKHTEILGKYFTDTYLAKYMRKHYLWYLKGISGINDIKAQIAKAETTQESLKLIKNVVELLKNN